ncbi:hypothetical protein MJN76_30265, partial [Salmonella enterica subsp. enterica serovar Anatum]|nr:hypothetical protein [Salmonella enterica subsp. enterica serovar Anatum]
LAELQERFKRVRISDTSSVFNTDLLYTIELGHGLNVAECMAHASTSPSYPIVASIETAAAMLRGNPGKRLINRSVERALHFRKEV